MIPFSCSDHRGLQFTTQNLSPRPSKLSTSWDLSSERDHFYDPRECLTLVHMQEPVQVREVASVVGLMVSAFSGVQYAPLFYRSLENDKINALKCNGWDLEGKMTLSPLSKQDLQWWISNVDQYPKAITPLPPDITLMTDSSLKGRVEVIESTPSLTRGR